MNRSEVFNHKRPSCRWRTALKEINTTRELQHPLKLRGSLPISSASLWGRWVQGPTSKTIELAS